jgi:hypothetical protein
MITIKCKTLEELQAFVGNNRTALDEISRLTSENAALREANNRVRHTDLETVRELRKFLNEKTPTVSVEYVDSTKWPNLRALIAAARENDPVKGAVALRNLTGLSLSDARDLFNAPSTWGSR